MIPIISSISSLARETDAWLVDIWGVMHNGVEPFAGAVDACRRFRDAGGVVLLLSNAPRPASSVATQLETVGVSSDAWDSILSSGDASRVLIEGQAGSSVFHIGPERDLVLFDGAPVELGDAASAQSIICSGLFDDTSETPDDYEDMLNDFRARDLEMICVNPDIKVERGNQVIYCGGAIAQAYVDKGGTVQFAGKPYLPIYKMAFERIASLLQGEIDVSRVLAIGDGVKTDIKGAAEAGVRSVYIASGVHLAQGQTLSQDAVMNLFPDVLGRPCAAMTGLIW